MKTSLKALAVLASGELLYSIFKFSSRGELHLDKAAASGGSAANAQSAGQAGTGGAFDPAATEAEIAKSSIPPGESIIVPIAFLPVIVVNSGGTFKAFDSTCTHLGCLVKWDSQSNGFKCPCHGGTYDKDGQVTAGPPPAALKRFNVIDNGDKIKIALK